MTIDVRILEEGQEGLLANVIPGVFDHPIVLDAAREFLKDPRHHLAVALEDGVVAGFASAVHYLHPDKARPELWINEIAVSEQHRNRGLGKRLLKALLEAAKRVECTEAWVLTDRSNEVAKKLYSSVGGFEKPDQVMFTIPLEKDPLAE